MDQEPKQQFDVQAFLSNTPKYYSNVAQIASSFNDFQLMFGNQVFLDFLAKDQGAINVQCILHMSPTHFKAFAKVVDEQLKKFEDKYGKINDLPDETISKSK